MAKKRDVFLVDPFETASGKHSVSSFGKRTITKEFKSRKKAVEYAVRTAKRRKVGILAALPSGTTRVSFKQLQKLTKKKRR